MDPALRARIRSLFFAEHWKLGTIAAQLGVHHDTVHRAVEVERMASPHTRACQSLLEPYKAFVEQTLTQYPRLRATRLLEMLRLRGYTGGYGILRNFVRGQRGARRHEAFVPLRVLPGEQAQVDWGSFGTVQVGHAKRSLSCFVLVLSHSRALFARFFLDQQMGSFLAGHVEAFERLGGAPRAVLYDNLKSVVLERVGEHVRFHPRVLELAGHYHFVPRPCHPYRPQEKGRVERHVRYLRESFFAARSFRDLADLNAQLDAWIAERAHQRPVPSDPAGTVVHAAWQQEREVLVPLPEHPFVVEEVRPVSVGKTPRVRFDSNDYSVPPQYVQRTLSLGVSPQTVRVLDGATEIARHARCFDRGQTLELSTHRESLDAHKRGAHALRGRDRLRAACPSAERFFALLAQRGEHLARPAVRLGQLLDRHGAPALEAALSASLERGSVSAEGVAHMLAQRARAQGEVPAVPVPLPPEVAARVPPQRPHDLRAYDALSGREEGSRE